MSKPAGPRDRLIHAAITLVQEKGVEGAGLAEILEVSNSARGSLYQHFPRGKQELIGASTRASGDWMRQALRDLAQEMSLVEMLDAMHALMVANLVESDYRLGCPIAAAAAAPADAREVREAAGEAFGLWVAEIEAKLVADGRPAAQARSLASFVVSAVEGALLCARAARSTDPLDQAHDQLVRLVSLP